MGKVGKFEVVRVIKDMWRNVYTIKFTLTLGRGGLGLSEHVVSTFCRVQFCHKRKFLAGKHWDLPLVEVTSLALSALWSCRLMGLLARERCSD